MRCSPLTLILLSIHTLFTMSVTLIDTKSITVEGLKTVFKVPHSDVCVVNGKAFICLVPYRSSLVSLILEDNEMAPTVRDKDFSLTRSTGLLRIKEARNHAQALELGPVEGSNLFELPIPKKSKKAVTPMQEMEKQYEDRVPITITLLWDAAEKDVVLLRPVQARDSLWVEYNADSIAWVIKMLREGGFEEEPFTQRKAKDLPILPKGVVHFRGGYKVLWQCDVTARKMHGKVFSDMDEAVRFQAMDSDGKQQYIDAEEEAKKADGVAAAEDEDKAHNQESELANGE